MIQHWFHPIEVVDTSGGNQWCYHSLKALPVRVKRMQPHRYQQENCSFLVLRMGAINNLWRNAKDRKDTEQYPHQKTKANQRYFLQQSWARAYGVGAVNYILKLNNEKGKGRDHTAFAVRILSTLGWQSSSDSAAIEWKLRSGMTHSKPVYSLHSRERELSMWGLCNVNTSVPNSSHTLKGLSHAILLSF